MKVLNVSTILWPANKNDILILRANQEFPLSFLPCLNYKMFSSHYSTNVYTSHSSGGSCTYPISSDNGIQLSAFGCQETRASSEKNKDELFTKSCVTILENNIKKLKEKSSSGLLIEALKNLEKTVIELEDEDPGFLRQFVEETTNGIDFSK